MALIGRKHVIPITDFPEGPVRDAEIARRGTNAAKTKAYRERRQAERNARQAVEQANEQAAREVHERTAEEKREAKLRQDIAEFGREAVNQRDWENVHCILLNEAVRYAQGRESGIKNDDDFAELSDDLEELFAKYEHIERQNYAIEFAFLAARDAASTGRHFSWFQQKLEWLCQAFPEQIDLLKSVPELHLPSEDLRKGYWIGSWDPEHAPKFSYGVPFLKPVLQSRWSNTHARKCLPIIRAHMQKIGKQISVFETPPIICPWPEQQQSQAPPV